MARTIEQEIQFCHGLSDEYKDLEKNTTREANKKAFRDYAEEYSQIAKWLEEVVALRKALDRACEYLEKMSDEAPCSECPYIENEGCLIGYERNNPLNCGTPAWWKAQILKEVTENEK